MVILFVWKNIMGIGRGGACVPARVTLQGRIHRSFPTHNTCILVWKRCCADVGAGTQAPPLRISLEKIARGFSPLRISFGWITRGTVGFVWVDCVQMVILFVWDCVEKYDEVGRGGAYVPARVAPRGRIHRSSSHGLASCYAKKAVHECGAQLFL